jgi:hypothetical protein
LFVSQQTLIRKRVAAMLKYDPLQLPSEEELPCSDDTPVDNELQNLIPNLLGAI